MKDFESSRSSEPTIAIHILTDTTDQKIDRFLDGGRLVSDLNDRGYSVALTDRNVFDATSAARRVVMGDGGYSLEDVAADVSSIHTMRSHLTIPLRRAGTEAIPKLNSNNLKELAGSKIELYERVLADYQVSTDLISMQPEDFDTIADLIHAVASKDVVLKSNAGLGGTSTRMFDKNEAIAWVAQQIEAGNTKPHILQPKIEFGRLPDDIRGIGEESDQLVKRARKENLLTELRFYALKNNEAIETIPVLRVVPVEGLPMQGSNDTYVEIELSDDLRIALDESTRAIIRKATDASGGDTHALGAVDYYFDSHGLPHVMEANFRTPGLPTSKLLPRAGRLVHSVLADVLVDMANNDARDRTVKDTNDKEGV
jgi:hypothetical protein